MFRNADRHNRRYTRKHTKRFAFLHSWKCLFFAQEGHCKKNLIIGSLSFLLPNILWQGLLVNIFHV